MSVLNSVFMQRAVYLLLLVLVAGVGWSAPVMALTVEPTTNQAGLVVVQTDGSVMSRCVGFNEESISGYDLLVRGDFAARTEATSMGASVCSVDGQGCGEGEACFCQCKSSTCAYWTYWRLLPEGWRYSNAGAAAVQVHDGDVQGWVWGDSKPNVSAENQPPALVFTDICNSDAVIYGIEQVPSVATSDANVEMSAPWSVALVVGAPLILGGAWWLWQRQRGVQA